jgi:hypothetical protein
MTYSMTRNMTHGMTRSATHSVPYGSWQVCLQQRRYFRIDRINPCCCCCRVLCLMVMTWQCWRT